MAFCEHCNGSGIETEPDFYGGEDRRHFCLCPAGEKAKEDEEHYLAEKVDRAIDKGNLEER